MSCPDATSLAVRPVLPRPPPRPSCHQRCRRGGGQLQAGSPCLHGLCPGLRDTPAVSWNRGTESWGPGRRARPSASNKFLETSKVWGRPGLQGQIPAPRLKPVGLEWPLRPIPAAVAQALFWLEPDLGAPPPRQDTGSPALGSLKVPHHHLLSDGPGSLQLSGYLVGSWGPPPHHEGPYEGAAGPGWSRAGLPDSRIFSLNL